MGAENCKSPCGLNSDATEMQHDRPQQPFKYGTSGVEAPAPAAALTVEKSQEKTAASIPADRREYADDWADRGKAAMNAAPSTLVLSGATNASVIVDGEYKLNGSHELFPAWSKVGDNSNLWLVRVAITRVWQVRSNKTTEGGALCLTPHLFLQSHEEVDLPTKATWQVWTGKEWITQDVKVMDKALMNGQASYGHGHNGSYSSTYFGREAPELARLSSPPEGAHHRYHKAHSFRTGSTYNGQWVGNQRHGFGVHRWPDGAEFHGEWIQNTASGKGRFKHSDGSVYVGEWRQNIAHGLGIYRHKDGTTYEGCFAEDLQDGQGVETWPDRSKFVGQFARGKKNGYGLYTWPDGSRYEGEWRMNQIDGIGSYFGSDQRQFSGGWWQSMMHGLGKYTWQDGRAYEGQYKEDQKDGYGAFTWADGRYYQGFWREGRQHGYGHLHGDGDMQVTLWENGERVQL